MTGDGLSRTYSFICMSLLVWTKKSRPGIADSLGWILFQSGLFFLCSSAFLAGLFLIPAMVLGSLRRRSLAYFQDRWNYPLCLAGILMSLSCLRAFTGWLAWVGLANWLPLFWAFWAFQPYLRTGEARRRASLWLIAGSVPVVITGLGQLWWSWQGPWQLFNGLIVWFVAPNGQPTGRLSGLFDYANIAGAWLVMIWPLCLAALLQPSLNRRHRSIVCVLALGIVSALILTDSRNAWGGFVLALPFVIGPASWFWLLPLLILLFIPVGLAIVPGVGIEVQTWARRLVPDGLWSRLNDMQYVENRPFEARRLTQWQVAIEFIAERPLLGWGAAAFSVLYPLRTGLWHGHSHNLPLELGVSHGVLVSLLIVGTVVALLITGLKRGVLNSLARKNDDLGVTFFDRAWWTACLVLVFLHGTDMPIFDSRINIAGWILLAGLRCLVIQDYSKPVDDVQLIDRV